MLEEFALTGRVALVTGSARGLGFEIARGMAAALPFVDDFVEGHSLESLESLAELVGER